jgi:hypothetical protein
MFGATNITAKIVNLNTGFIVRSLLETIMLTPGYSSQG